MFFSWICEIYSGLDYIEFQMRSVRVSSCNSVDSSDVYETLCKETKTWAYET